jgi:hypothetical protein
MHSSRLIKKERNRLNKTVPVTEPPRHSAVPVAIVPTSHQTEDSIVQQESDQG